MDCSTPGFPVLHYLQEFAQTKAMAPHSCTLAWKVRWTEEPGGLHYPGGVTRAGLSDFTFRFSLSCIGEGNGNPL